MRAVLCSALCLASWPGHASQVQNHGLNFERWVAGAFFGGCLSPDPTAKWDIPASANRNHGGIPVNPKAAQYGEPVLLGDALRQYDIDEPFLLVVGFWKQDARKKKLVQSLAVRVEPEQWRKLWAPVTRADVEALDRLVKDVSRPFTEVRREVLRLKRQPPFAASVIRLNPKIDGSQRRLQCSISYIRLFDNLAPGLDRRPRAVAEVFGRVVPPLPASPRRRF